VADVVVGEREPRTAVGVWWLLVKARVRGDLQYPLSFGLFCAGQVGATFLDFVALVVLQQTAHLLAGWTLPEVAYLYATGTLAFNLADVFASEVEYLPDRIRTGTFDRLLVRPVSPLLQLLAEEFALRRAAKVVESLAVLAYALWATDVDWTPLRVAMVPLTVVSGSVIFAAIWVTTATLAFWTTEASETASAFTYGGNLFTQYPLGVYGDWMRRFLGFVIPLAFVAYFPARYVLDKHDSLGLPRALDFSAPLVAVIAVAVAARVWRAGLDHYTSTGS
jgi:ABC-2 type transport system permease protein